MRTIAKSKTNNRLVELLESDSGPMGSRTFSIYVNHILIGSHNELSCDYAYRNALEQFKMESLKDDS